jgi:hypothetical protein
MLAPAIAAKQFHAVFSNPARNGYFDLIPLYSKILHKSLHEYQLAGAAQNPRHGSSQPVRRRSKSKPQLGKLRTLQSNKPLSQPKRRGIIVHSRRRIEQW